MTASIRRVHPAAAVAGGQVVIEGDGFDVAPGRLPAVTIAGHSALLTRASPTALAIRVPDALPGGSLPIAIEGVAGATAFVAVGRALTTGVHQVDSPVCDSAGRLYATLSGSRGQETPVSVFRVDPDGGREPFVTGIPNATSVALDREERLWVSSRFDGVVYRVTPEGTAEAVGRDLGIACGLAFGSDGTLHVGDRSGTIHRLAMDGTHEPFATLPPSIAAYHLAMAADDTLYVTAPTLNSSDTIYRIDRSGEVTRWVERFGRPQGLAFDPQGRLHVVDALAGDSGVYRLTPEGDRDLVVAGQGLVGVAFDRAGGLIVCTADTVFRFDPPAG
jgi:sugar lactone lactonase YvrE